MFGEEYLPTDFRDSVGREYAIHVTVKVAAEICRRHKLALHDLSQSHRLSFDVLLDVADIGTRYQSKAKEQSKEDFIDAIGDDVVSDVATAAGNALLNFFLRSQKVDKAQCKALADQYAVAQEAAKREVQQEVLNLIATLGAISTN